MKDSSYMDQETVQNDTLFVLLIRKVKKMIVAKIILLVNLMSAL